MYEDIAPLDPAGVLRREWLNSRGAIARFDRNAIEIRVLDTQECVGADLAVAGATFGLARALFDGSWCSLEQQQALSTDALVRIFSGCVRDAGDALIDHRPYLDALGFGSTHCKAAELWGSLVERLPHDPAYLNDGTRALLRRMIGGGCLARRMLDALGPVPRPSRLHELCESLCACLEHGSLFEPGFARPSATFRGGGDAESITHAAPRPLSARELRELGYTE
jgi:carboxylate-amine ligase